MNLKQAKQVVEQVSRSAYYHLNVNGFHLHQAEVLPALQRFKTGMRSKRERILLAEAFNRVGDLYNVCLRAPKSALRYHRQCVFYNPKHRFGWNDIAHCLAYLGHYKSAFAAWRNAIQVIREHYPDEQEEIRWFQSEIEYATKSMRSGYPPECQCIILEYQRTTGPIQSKRSDQAALRQTRR